MPRIGETSEVFKCNFCTKSQKQVKRLIAGDGVYICDECIGLCNEIIEEEFPRVETFGLQAASAAALLLAAGTKGKRLALPNSRILIHQPATEGGYGQSSDLEIQAKEIMRIRELMENMLAADTGQSVTKVSRDIERDKYLTAQEAVEYGIVDDILTSLKDVGA